MNEKYKVSVVVPVYNHQKYIAQALESILIQKTGFAFEVLIGDDASTDESVRIIKKYAAEYPELFRAYYRESNMYSRGESNMEDLLKRTKGEYVIILEGDDFWLNPNKLQIQADFLDTHAEYIAVAHNVVVVDESSQKREDFHYPESKDEEYTIRHYGSNILPGQTATLMYRNFYKSSDWDYSLLLRKLIPGDRLICFVLLTHGRIFCIQEAMSAYRYVNCGGSSYSATFRYDAQKDLHWHRQLAEYAHTIDTTRLHISVAEMLFLRVTLKAWLGGQISVGEALRNISWLRYKGRAFFLYIKRLINHKIIRKQFWI